MTDTYCYYFSTLQKGTHYITHSESGKFLVRMYTHTKKTGAVMLANIGLPSGKIPIKDLNIHIK